MIRDGGTAAVDELRRIFVINSINEQRKRHLRLTRGSVAHLVTGGAWGGVQVAQGAVLVCVLRLVFSNDFPP